MARTLQCFAATALFFATCGIATAANPSSGEVTPTPAPSPSPTPTPGPAVEWNESRIPIAQINTSASTSSPTADTTYGWSFTANNPIVVTDLGVYDAGDDGLAEEHTVTIWDASGAVIATVPVPATGSTPPPTEAGFRYVQLPNPVTLPAGQYTIGAYYTTSADALDDQQVPALSAEVTYDAGRSGTGAAEPTTPASAGYFGPNFRFVPSQQPDVFTLTVSGDSDDWQGQQVTITITPAQSGEDFDLYIRRGDTSGPIVASSAQAGDATEQASFSPSALGVGDYAVEIFYRDSSSGCVNDGICQLGDRYGGTATVTAVDAPQTRTATYTTADTGGTIKFSPNVTLKAPVAQADGNPQDRTDSDGNHYVGGMRGSPRGTDLWYIDLRQNVDGSGNPTFDPRMRVPLYRGEPVPAAAVGGGIVYGFDGYLALAVSFGLPEGQEFATLAYSVLLDQRIIAGHSIDRGVTLGATQDPVPGPSEAENAVPVGPQQWEEFLGQSTVFLFYRSDPESDSSATGQAFINYSTDGGATFGDAEPTGFAIGTLGPVDLHQSDGVLYGGGRSGNIIVGMPVPTSFAAFVVGPPSSGYAFSMYPAASDPNGVGHALFVTKVADDGTTNGTVYGVYSNGHDIFLVHSTDQGKTWSAPVQVNDNLSTRTTNIFPWLETGPTPGSVGIVWYGTSAEANDNTADWKVYFAQTFTATSAAPAFEIAEVTQPGHFVHAGQIFDEGYDPSLDPSCVSAMASGMVMNHNLFDYIQVSFDPQGAAVVSYTDDHNDFRGNIYIARQIAGTSILGTALAEQIEAENFAAPTPPPDGTAFDTFPPPQPGPNGEQVTDFAGDSVDVSGNRNVGELQTVIPSAYDILSVTYGTNGSGNNLAIAALMQVGDVTSFGFDSDTVPVWRMSFTANATHPGISDTDTASGQYTYGLSDRGDQFYVEARFDPLAGGIFGILFGFGTTPPFSYAFGIAQRDTSGGVIYTELGAADFGFVDPSSNRVYVQISVAKLNATLLSGHSPIGAGSIITGLRAQTLQQEFVLGPDEIPFPVGAQFVSDTTRGGTQFLIRDETTQPPPTVQFTSGSYTAQEEDGNVVLVVTRTGDTSETVTVEYSTNDDTAHAPQDYTTQTGVLEFAPGETTKTITVALTDDSTPEPTESFNVRLANAQGGTLGAAIGSPSQAVVSITDHDVTPTATPASVQFEHAQYNANEGDGNAILTVTRSGDTSSSVTIDYTTTDGSATAGADYTTSAGTLTFASGETAKPISVPISDDATHENTEDFRVALSAPSAGAVLGSPSQAIVAITDNDPVAGPSPSATPATIQFNQAQYNANEADGSVILTVTRSGDTGSAVTVHYATTDGAAQAGSDYTATAGTLSFASGETAKPITVPITDDSADENTEDFGVSLSAPSSGATLGSPSQAIVAIVDNDTTATPSPTPANVELQNISARALVQTGDNVAIAGFIIRGDNAKRIVVRGLGPSTQVAGALQDPVLELHEANGATLDVNDNWQESSHAQEISAAGLAPADQRESAIYRTLDPGSYTAVLHGANNTTGVGLIEFYDLDTISDSHIVDLSARAFVDTGDNALISGVIIRGGNPQRILFRAIGPDLESERGVAGALQDPTLDVRDENGAPLGFNDDWRSDQETEIAETGLAPHDDRDAAFLQTLSAGNYTAITRGKADTAGVALGEIYNLGSP